jgi:hypothetical protein
VHRDLISRALLPEIEPNTFDARANEDKCPDRYEVRNQISERELFCKIQFQYHTKNTE